MRSFSTEFTDANTSLNREPRFVLTINNDLGVFNLVSHSDIVTGIEQFVCLSSTSATSQSITPEKGISVIGGMTITAIDAGLTDKIRSIVAAGDSLIANKSELYVGYSGMDFADYGKLATYWVDDVNNSYNSYSLVFKDTQRFIKQSVFDPKITKFNGEFDRDDNITSLEVVSTDGFELVEHTSEWKQNPGQTVGYFRIKGVDSLGFDSYEIFSYTGKTSTEFTGVTRSEFSTRPIEVALDSEVEVEEFIYLDLPVIDMIIAILTGDLIGQPGQVIPSHWSAGISADKINLASFQAVTNLNLQLDFQQPIPDDAKIFLYEQVLFPFNLFIRVDANGELELSKFSDISEGSGFSVTLDDRNVSSFSGIKRTSTDIRNRFEILWQYQHTDSKFLRRNIYVDNYSIQRNKYTSKIKSVNIQGIRNTSADAEGAVFGIAERISSRYSNQSMKANATVFISDAVELEVGDTVRVVLDYPDYNSTGTLDRTMEIQKISIDFASGDVSLSLFANSLLPSIIDEVTSGADVDFIDHSGPEWVRLDTALGGGFYSIDGTELTVIANQTLVGGNTTSDKRFYWDGNVIIDNGVTLSTTKNFLLDCDNLTLGTNSTIDSSSNGYPGGAGGDSSKIIGYKGTKGFFGNQDVAGRGTSIASSWGKLRHDGRNATVRYASSIVAATDGKLTTLFKPHVTMGGEILGLPENLIGSSGSGGAESFVDVSGAANPNGGIGGASGGGIVLICDAFFSVVSSLIRTDGGDSSRGDFWDSTGAQLRAAYGGTGGVGYPGGLLVLVKKRASSYPLLSDITSIISGSYPEDTARPATTGIEYDNGDVNHKNEVNLDTIIPYTNKSAIKSVSNKDYYDNLVLARYLINDTAAINSPQDIQDSSALSPTLTLTKHLNTPLTPLGNQTTISVTALPQPGDNSFAYATFEYRAAGQNQWIPIEYVISTESSVIVTSDGSSYEFRATSINKVGIAGGYSVETTTVANVNKNSNTSEGGATSPPEILTVPPIRRLKLVNQIDVADNWNKFKSGDAVFSWAKTSITAGGNITSINGELDLHFRGYKIRILSPTGDILREEITLDSFYTYTREENIKDGTGRSFRFDVQNLASTGFVTSIVGIDVENPEPESPNNIASTVGFTSVAINFDLPTDIDFVGVDFYLVEGTGNPFLETPLRLSGNSVISEGLIQNTEYRYGLTSVDEFGSGASSPSLAFTTQDLNAADVSGLGPWSTISVADNAFIDTYIEDGSIVEALIASGGVTNSKLGALAVDAAKLATSAVTSTKIAALAVGTAAIQNLAVSSAKIASVVASKITAGTLAAAQWIQVGTDTQGVRIDGTSGTIQTKGGGGDFNVTVGPVSVPGESANPLVISSSDGASYPFWVDASGAGKFTGEITISGGSGISNLTDAGTLATQDDADWATDITGAGKPANNADVTEAAIEAGTTIGTGYLHLNGTTANIAIGASSTFGTKGIQLDYNSGAPRAYIGDPANSYLEYSASGFVLAVDRIGAGSTSGVNSIAFGENSTASGGDSVSIGSGSSAQSSSSTSIGYLSEISATASSAIAIGRSVSIGTNCNSSISIGTNSEILDNSSDSVALGTGSSVGGFSAIAVGYESEVIDDSGVSIGAYTSSGKNSVAIGDSASSPSQGSISIGVASYASWGGSTGNVALGPNAVASFQNTVAIGDTAIANVVNRFTLGNSNNKIYVPGSEISIQGNEVWHNGNDDFDNAVTGHIRYPNGLKIAWGDGTSSSDSSQSFSYGTSFTGVRRVIVSSAGSTTPGTTSFTHNRVDDLGGSFTFSWIAIGWS